MRNKVTILPERLLPLMFDVLFGVRAELQAMRDTAAQVYFDKTGNDDFLEYFKENLERAEKKMISEIRLHYTGFDVDALLNSVTKKGEDDGGETNVY